VATIVEARPRISVAVMWVPSPSLYAPIAGDGKAELSWPRHNFS